jgi:hypothetical protein
MDHSIPYFSYYASNSDDDGSDEEIDVGLFTAMETEILKKVLGWVPLFCNLSLADETVVDGGKNLVLKLGQVSTEIWITTIMGFQRLS